jgi:hypothetical protein
VPRWYSITDPTGVLTVNFNGPFTDTGLIVPDENGVYWTIEELEGWDGPDMRQVLIDIYGVDGIDVGVNEFSSRLLTLSNGFAFAPSENAKWNAQHQFGQLLAATLAQGECQVVVHEDTDYYISGYLASKPEWKDVPPGSVASYAPVGQWPFQFEASLVCPYPLKLSANGASPYFLPRDGSAVVPTLGNYPTNPTITFDFPANNDSVTDQDGNTILVTSTYRGSNADMPDALHIDVAARTVTDQIGNPAWDCIATIQWFQLKPQSGSTLAYHLGSSSPLGTQQCAVAWLDAWL